MQLSNNVYELHCYVSNFVYNNQFLAKFEMSQSLPFLMNMYVHNVFKTFVTVFRWIVCLNPAGIYVLNVNKRNTSIWCEICSKLTINTPKRTYFKPSFSISIVNFDYVIAGGKLCFLPFSLPCFLTILSSLHS